MYARKNTSDYPAKKRRLTEEIQAENFRPCYLIYGEEAYLRSQNRDELKRALLGDGDRMNLFEAQDEEIDVQAAVDFAQTMPFFAPRRVLMLTETGLFEKEAPPALEAYLKDPADTAVIVFCETEVDKRRSLFKTVQKTGFEISCDKRPYEELTKWVAVLLRKAGKKITPDAVARLLDLTGTEMNIIKNETDKLIDYTGEREAVTVQDVEDVCAGWLEGRIFDMTDAIAAKNRERAFSLYLDLLALKEKPQRILALVAREFLLLLQIAEMKESRAGMDAMMRATGLPQKVVSKYLGWNERFSSARLKEILQVCLRDDHAAKSGRLDMTISIEMLIMQCTQ